MITSLSKKECTQIIANNYVGHLAYIYNDRPYVVPITYFFDANKDIIGYSTEGHKTMALRKNNTISLEVSEIENINTWQSVLVHGTFIELSGSDAKKSLHDFANGIKNLVMIKEDKDLHFINEFSTKIYDENVPIVFKITVHEITGKIRKQLNE